MDAHSGGHRGPADRPHPAGDGDRARERRWRRTNLVVGVSGALALLGGIVLALAVHGLAAAIAGATVAGLGGIALVSLAFLLVGQGEERDRVRRPHG